MTGERGTVLVVDDEPSIADGHAARLEDRYEVDTAYDGASALEKLDESVAVVLLDRRMPDLSGDEVLETIRERDLPCRVAMVTAVEPDFDIVDMGFDGYLQKPVDRESLLETVETLQRRVDYDTKLQEFFSLASRAALLRLEYDQSELTTHEEYQRLDERIEELRADLDDTLADLPPRESYAIAAEGNASADDGSRV
ncbi:MAG: response regulator transcription factor [Haloarculaceae archaeon]